MIDLNKASKGDKEALDELVSLYNEKIGKIASIYVGNHFEDIVQDVWLKILEKRYLLSSVDNFENWLFFVVRNTCFNYLKLEKKRRCNFKLTLYENIDFIDNQVIYPDIMDKMILEESVDILRSIIENLSEMYSLPIVMHYMKDMSLAEIAQVLDLPLSTIKWRIHAGKLQIKNEIIKRDLI